MIIRNDASKPYFFGIRETEDPCLPAGRESGLILNIGLAFTS